jgi:RHH-type transcriptional regulator, proline utilization regulon repressor / proline dehydrogenase / delta 1-pyrroline-5-carboxylate dehydrogenase
MSIDPTVLEQEILRIGQELYGRMQGETPGVFNKDYWQGRILEWAMKDPSFKVDMFRFVDVLPTLETKEQVAAHVKEYLLKDGRELPAVLSAALKAASSGLTAGLGAMAIKKNVTDMAGRFIVGTNAKEALKVLKKLHKDGIAFTVDLLGEATVSEAECDAYAARYTDLIDNLADEVSTWKEDEIIDRNHLGPMPRTNVSLKVSAMYSQIDPADPAGSVARLKARVLPLFLRAKERGVFVNVDLEQWALHDITYDLFEEVLAHPELSSWPHVGIVVQAYLRSSPRDVERLASLAKRRGAPITVRLVKGAYWDYETVLARQQGWDSPVFEEKAATDANYERLSATMLDHIEHLLPAFGSHNLRSVTHALVLAKEKKVPERAYEVQMLYGMAEPERRVFRGLGHRVRVYAPVGELLPGMAYLVRRLLENTSNSGFLRLSHVEGADTAKLLEAPRPLERPVALPQMRRGDLTTPFENCPLLDFTHRPNQERFATAVSEVRNTLPLEVPVVVGGEVRHGEGFERRCPSETSLLVAKVTAGTLDDVDRALARAAAAFPAWRDRPLQERAQLLEQLGDVLEADRHEGAALMCFEVGKPWRSADADLAEAVDFCRFYARQALCELAERSQGSLAGEDNRLSYEGRGPCVVIAPWNFPNAILTGMAAAALVAGNPVVMKPAEQASGVAFWVYQRFLRAGFPKDVVQFLPGVGEDIGPALVNDPRVAQIAFTGSKQVGLFILEAAGKTWPGQPQVKRVVCEMGGKNAIVVDDDADLDEAVLGVLESAFGYAGQKCSACSRVIVVGSAQEAFTERLVAAAKSLEMGPAHQAGVGIGPVVDEEAHQRLLAVLKQPGERAEVIYSGEPREGGWYVPPTILRCDDPAARVMQDEFFGPVLTVCFVPDFKAALDVALDTQFALTGAVFSRSPAHLSEARRRFRVGNLYLNRGSTGALVHRQPFGGFAMSGTGTKAGGPGYLLHFADLRVITENTMRRGFTPELET